MALKLILQLSFRNILRHKRRNGMLFIAITMAVASVAGLNTIIRGMQADLMEAVVENLTGHIKVHAPGYRDDPSMQHAFALDADFHPEVPADSLLGWAPRVRIPGVVMSERETRGIQLVGVDPAAEHISFLSDVPVDGERLQDATDRRILIGKELAAQLETSVGRRIVVITQGADGRNRERGYRIVGTYDADGTGLEKVFVFTGLSDLQDLLDSQGVTEVSIRLREDLQRERVRDGLRSLFAGVEVLDWMELEPQAAAMYIYADSAIYFWFVLMMSALTFGLVNTLVASVMERVRELGMLRALGMRRSTVVAQVVIESTIIMTVGVVLGLFGGYLVYLSIADGIDLSAFAEGVEMAGVRSFLTPRLYVDDFVLVAGMSLALGVVASLYPAWRAVKIQPLDAMRR